MKAYVLHGIGDLRLEDRPAPEIQSGWALVRVKTAGICSSDIPRIFRKGTYHFPTIPGHEFCGVVEKVADKENAGWIGKRVGVFPLIPCKICPSCQKGEYETCSHYDYIGSRRDGGFAEYVAVPVWNLIELPDAVDDVQGALLEPAAVALHAVRQLGKLDGKSVCVVGTGAIGMLVGQWAKTRGAKQVVMKGRGEKKRCIAEESGLLYQLGCEGKYDCVVEAVGSPDSISESLDRAAPNGKLVLLGNPAGDISLKQNTYWKILRKQLTVLGSWNSSYGRDQSDWFEVLRAMDNGEIFTKPLVTHHFGKQEMPQALSIMKEKKEIFCKILVDFKEGSW